MDVPQTITHLRTKGLTFCGRSGKLETLYKLTATLERESVPGLFLEAGVAMGGSASVIAKVKAPDRELRLYDLFALLPPPSARDGAGARQAYERFLAGKITSLTDAAYLAHAKDLLDFARQTMRETGIDLETSNIHFVKGLFQDTLKLDGPVAFAHIDCDWYDSVVLCIERIADLVSPRGIMLFDDYNSFPGCREAVDAWLARDPRFRIIHLDWTLAAQRVDGGAVTAAPAPPR